MTQSSLFIGCAGWSLPAAHAPQFPTVGTHLQRYAQRFGAVEINSSFYRPHRPQTYAKWAASVPDDFRFAVKTPKIITHERRLKNSEGPLESFLSEISHLGAKLGPLLVQMPPSLAFDSILAETFFATLRTRFTGDIVCEPRHISWFAPEADVLLTHFRIARVRADPSLHSLAAVPGGWGGLAYFRLHGSPRIYYSAYSAEFLGRLKLALDDLEGRSIPVWCIFDNTAQGAATENALALLSL